MHMLSWAVMPWCMKKHNVNMMLTFAGVLKK